MSNMMSMIDVTETQKRIRKGIVILFGLATAIDKMPESDARIDLIAKHHDVLMKLNDLYNGIGEVDDHTCYYGFMPKCPGGVCDECPGVLKILEMNHIPTVEEFDSKRVESARRYYESLGEPRK